MLCWALAIVFQLCLLLLAYDVVQGYQSQIPTHLLYSVVICTIFYIACSVLGETLSMGILIIPCVFLAVQVGKNVFASPTTVVKPQCLRATPAPTACSCPTACTCPSPSC
jgi:hypothetical protein